MSLSREIVKYLDHIKTLASSLPAETEARVRLLLHAAGQSLEQAEEIIAQFRQDEDTTVDAGKLRLWERKSLDLSLRNNLLNIRPGRNAVPFDTADISLLEDELDQDSILDDCIALSLPLCHLSWHYRSQHESLIAFSNHNFYRDRHVVMPSVLSRLGWNIINVWTLDWFRNKEDVIRQIMNKLS